MLPVWAGNITEKQYSLAIVKLEASFFLLCNANIYVTTLFF